MKVPTKKRVKEVEGIISKLCGEISAPVVCALAATTCGWKISVEKPKSDKDYVRGVVVGDDEFLKKHNCF